MFRKAYSSDTGGKIISCLYKGLLNIKTHSSSYIKTSIFWDFSVIKDYWRGIHKAQQDIFKCETSFASKTIYFGYIPQDWSKGDKLLINALLAAGKKKKTKKKNSHTQESPTLKAWMEIAMDSYKMERITAFVNYKSEQFASRWQKWVFYVEPLRPDFTFTNQ